MSKTPKRPTVADIRAMKGKRTLTMLYVETPEEAAAAAEAGVDMLSIIDPVWTSEMRDAAGACFVQVGLLYGELVTLEDYQRAAHHAMQVGGDCVYCASSFGTIKALADDGIPVVSHVGLIPSKATWTGGFKAVGKTADSALSVFEHVRKLEEIGCFGAELEVVPDRIAAEIACRTSLVLLGMGAGPYADAQYLFAEDVLGYTRGHKPRHARTYRDFRSELDRLQRERVAAFGEFVNDVTTGAYPAAAHCVGIEDDEFSKFMLALND
ncbi:MULTISPECIES: 3-methyl-2-oxobutanoate hydroxymethyltransferase [Marinovum]|jgi:3-methyl-2-oxobutanoate hydroxymethyltransferase|uniref:3-methyl-2-oxobutanoate hydroxymethyltransferase n=1 Tax=Marinovum algicola TaxID=42444 RepID=A0A975WCI6_9RHOB|nr:MULTISPECIES: 3-methyl-2-oxobutanoate hydroxymethyltransferase [Marinovum]MDD9739480.1 3-methyl-2-oxobutanoate hydroxymethyltransferase [Marinovum sp. SP66]MDD9746197.1 3-methyl-2-oxobutanoate hydroxymethyltransferase [Marinovum sp. PR37]SEJ91172.1 ketopantoate hydroxymethyltransferase [Marinovum algicola]SLN42076.1 3-methyl-2-oxobutanoate hydroxymethyltransferase [Marinovum algicola]